MLSDILCISNGTDRHGAPTNPTQWLLGPEPPQFMLPVAAENRALLQSQQYQDFALAVGQRFQRFAEQRARAMDRDAVDDHRT